MAEAAFPTRRLRCPRCGTVSPLPAGRAPRCPACGLVGAAPPPAPAPPPAFPPAAAPASADAPWHAMPRHGQDRFFLRPAPTGQAPFLWWSALRRHRLALLLFGSGFFSVFLIQSHAVVQLVFGAPIFEEMLKFGLALLLVAWLPAARGGAGRVAGGALLALAAGAVGAGFGVLEHVVTYRDVDDRLSYLWRVLFHGGSTALSALAFAILEAAPDVRTRWLAVAPSVLLHYANNAGALVFSLLTTLAPPLEPVLESWNLVILAGLAAAAALVAARPAAVRRQAARLVQSRFGPPPAAGPPAAPRAPAGPAPSP